jgi:hypothetical protein
MLSLSPKYDYFANEDLISITYSPDKGIIAAGTHQGNIAMWKYMPHQRKSGEPEASWKLLHAKLLYRDVPIKKLRVPEKLISNTGFLTGLILFFQF